jgi:arginine/lysine/ornithine decarboxylase
VLEALDRYRERDEPAFTPPGHKQARGAVPAGSGIRLEQVMLPRDAYFGEVADVPVAEAAGRVAAEMLTPYPPGIPAALPGERLTPAVLRCLRTGIEAGMNLPDAADAGKLRTVRVVGTAQDDGESGDDD